MADDLHRASDAASEAVNRVHWSFGHLLGWHLLRGSRPGGRIDRAGRKWSNKEFAHAIGFGDRTIRYWLKDEHLPPDTETIERVLFGNDDYYAEWRLELRYAHVRSSSGPNTNISALSQTTQNISNIPVHLPMHFMGRENDLNNIEAALSNKTPVAALYGLPGIGKTVLAAAYADRHRKSYRVTWWIRADNSSTIKVDLLELGRRLNWIDSNIDDPSAFTRVGQFLRDNNDRILLIFDNAFSADSLQTYLPRSTNTHVLITSTNHVWRGIARLIDVKIWPKSVGAEYLIARTGRYSEIAAATALSISLGGLPLAHEQAAAYCERLEVSFSDYQRRLEAAPVRLLAADAPSDYYGGRAFAQTFSLAINAAAQLHIAAPSMLTHAALMAEPIPLSLFLEGRQYFEEPLASSLIDIENTEKIAAALRAFALIDRDTIEDSSGQINVIGVHRLIREIAIIHSAETIENAKQAVADVLLHPSSQAAVWYWDSIDGQIDAALTRQTHDDHTRGGSPPDRRRSDRRRGDP
jgi:NB-ARC domain